MFQLDTDESVRLLTKLLDFVAISLQRRIESGACAVHLFVLVRDFGKAVADRDTRGLGVVPPSFFRNEPGFHHALIARWCQLPGCFRRSWSAFENRKGCAHL